jgi:hypothetical protein
MYVQVNITLHYFIVKYVKETELTESNSCKLNNYMMSLHIYTSKCVPDSQWEHLIELYNFRVRWNFCDQVICFTFEETEAQTSCPLPNFTVYFCFQSAL